MAVNVTVTFDVKNSDGTPFHNTVLSYPNMDRPQLLVLEAALLQAILDLNKRTSTSLSPQVGGIK